MPRGQSCVRVMSVVNRGRMAVPLGLGPAAQELLQRLGVELLPASQVSTWQDACGDTASRQGVSMLARPRTHIPHTCPLYPQVVLRPRETVDFSFFYRPRDRQRPWAEELVLDAGGAGIKV